MEKIIIIPGSYKPPHIGHYKLIEEILKKEKIKTIYIIISFKSRYLNENNKNKGEITSRQSKEIWNIYLSKLNRLDNKKIKIIISEESPILMVMKLIKGIKTKNEIILIKSDKNIENKRFEKIKNKNKKIEEWIIPQYKNINARDLRKIIMQKDKEKFKMYLPEILNDKEIDKIWKILIKK